MGDIYNLKRFIEAQNSVFDVVLEELRNARKESHWVWFVFPQIKGLGSSQMAKRFAISSADEARHYLKNATLSERLYLCADIVNQNAEKSATEIFGHVDAMKFYSSITLFDYIKPESVFSESLKLFFNSERDQNTLRILSVSDE